jgi:hypothetical protein
MKETSFVYQDKRGFFLHFGHNPAKIEQNTGKSGFGAASRLLRSPFFCVLGPDQAENAGVLLGVLYGCKGLRKGTGIRDSDLPQDKNV